METLTVKLKKGEYTDFVDVFDSHDCIILKGARGSGKSFPTARYIGKELLKDEEAKFVYMRISKEELSTYASWCKDLNLSALCGSDNYELTRGSPTKGDIKLTAFDDDEKITYERVIGKCVSLEKSAEFKSGNYEEFKYLVFEEYTRKKMNPRTEEDYVFNFFENIVSFFRDREKKVFLLSNNFQNIPLLDRGIDETEGEIFRSALKIKIFRELEKGKKTNAFLSYLNGEKYEDDSFKIRVNEFFPLYTNKDFIIKQHIIYPKKFYITANKEGLKINYRENEFLLLKYFCQTSASNEFYYQSTSVEKGFTEKYFSLLAEISAFCVEKGSRFILPY